MMLKSMLMSRRQKTGLGIVFALVLVTIAFDILRTVFTLKMRTDFQDENAVWALMEPTVAVIICALPVYRGLLSWDVSKSPFRSLLSSFSRSFSNISGEKGSMRSDSLDQVVHKADQDNAH
jgi:hypothetical protein